MGRSCNIVTSQSQERVVERPLQRYKRIHQTPETERSRSRAGYLPISMTRPSYSRILGRLFLRLNVKDFVKDGSLTGTRINFGDLAKIESLTRSTRRLA